MTDDHTPHECGLGKFCDTQTAIGCIGRDALLRVAKEGPVQQIRPISIDGPPVRSWDRWWPITANGKRIGHVSSAAHSPDFDTNVRHRHGPHDPLGPPGTSFTVATSRRRARRAGRGEVLGVTARLA